ncbi:MAG: sulfite exporter TauE/SafE family protein, partial [Rhodobacteraceae bacterium]|nr:sulfite exporter TauE/SafE family protein [Paracoccaceae bacterium]
MDPTLWIIVIAITLGAGFVKGAVGFAMPMIMISGFATVLPPDTALAALILPTLVTNVWQGGRDGLRAAWDSVRDFRLYLLAIAVCIAASA